MSHDSTAQMLQTRAGELWMPTQLGFGVADAEALALRPESMRVHIDEITADGTSLYLDDRASLRLASATRRLTFSLAVVDSRRMPLPTSAHSFAAMKISGWIWSHVTVRPTRICPRAATTYVCSSSAMTPFGTTPPRLPASCCPRLYIAAGSSCFLFWCCVRFLSRCFMEFDCVICGGAFRQC